VVRDYELMYIIRPELDDEAMQASMDGVGALIQSYGGQVTKITPWGKRRLAFEVKHLREGHYVLTKLTLDGDRVTDLERTLRISDTVFRHLLVLDEGTPDDESGVPGRPSRAPRAAGVASIPDIPAHVPKALVDDIDDDGDIDDDDIDGDIIAVAPPPVIAEPAGVAIDGPGGGTGDDHNEENT